MSIIRPFHLFVAAALAVGPSLADDAITDVMTANDSTESMKATSFNSAGKWKLGCEPRPGTNYFTNGKCMMSPKVSSAITFQGASLRLNSEFWHVNGGATTIPNLIVESGANVYTVGAKGALYGTMNIGTDVDFEWCDRGSLDSCHQIGMDIVGDATTSIHLLMGYDYAVGLQFSGDLSQYYGQLRAFQANAYVSAVFTGDNTSFPGTLVCTNGATLKITVPDNVAVTIGSIDASDAEVTLGDGATLTVTGDVNLHGNKIRLSTTHAMTAAAERVSLLTFASADLTTDDVELTSWQASDGTGLANCPAALKVELAVDADSAGKTLKVCHPQVVYLKTSDTAKTTSIFDDGPGSTRWSVQLDASAAAEADYYITSVMAYRSIANKTFGFYGRSLTLAGWTTDTSAFGSFSAASAGTLTLDDFRWSAYGGSTRQMSTYCTFTLDGRVTVLPSAKDVYFGWENWNNCLVTINSTLQGSGGIRFNCNEAAGSNPSARFKLTGDNGAFTGRILLMHDAFTGTGGTYPPKTNPDLYFCTLFIAGESNLGGALEEFDAASLSIEDNSLLSVTGSAVFDEPTRGWRVRGHGRIGVAEGELVAVTNKTVTYADDGTDAGRFSKEGAGTLVLGGRAALDGTLAKTLEVKEDNLRFASTNAVDGVGVTFATDTKLEVDLSATGAFAQKGAVNSAAAPFVGATAETAIPLAPVATKSLPVTALKVAICTVSADLRDTLAFDCPKWVNRHRAAAVTSELNGDGTVTFFVNVAAKSGIAIYLK